MYFMTVPEKIALATSGTWDWTQVERMEQVDRYRTHVNGEAQLAPMRDSHFAVTTKSVLLLFKTG